MGPNFTTESLSEPRSLAAFFTVLPMSFCPLIMTLACVAIGKIDNSEIDFIATKADEKMYIQVTLSMTSTDVTERELALLRAIKDNYPKIVLSLESGLENSYDGIESKNIIQWLLDSSK